MDSDQLNHRRQQLVCNQSTANAAQRLSDCRAQRWFLRTPSPTKLDPDYMLLRWLSTDPLGTTSAIVSFDVFMNDVYALGGNPQISCVCLLSGTADPLTGTPIHILYGPADIFQSNPQTPNPYVHVSEDISSYMTPGQSYQLRVLVKNSNPFDVGVDNFSLDVSTPEPSTFVPLALLTAFLVYRRRTRVRLRT